MEQIELTQRVIQNINTRKKNLDLVEDFCNKMYDLNVSCKDCGLFNICKSAYVNRFTDIDDGTLQLITDLSNEWINEATKEDKSD